MIKGLSGYEGQWAYQKAKATDEVKEWDYDYIRRVNLMLDNIDGSQMNDTEKEHWRSVGYFFRSYKYFQMLSRFGDIPWVENALKKTVRNCTANGIVAIWWLRISCPT